MKAPKTKPAVPKRARPEQPRRKMPLISDEMKHWSAMLRSELEGWPQATARPMFGMLGFYRGKKIFAALPVTRALTSANAIIFRLSPMSPELRERAERESRIRLETPGAKWFAFEIGAATDLRDALWWLNQAYEAAKK